MKVSDVKNSWWGLFFPSDSFFSKSNLWRHRISQGLKTKCCCETRSILGCHDQRRPFHTALSAIKKSVWQTKCFLPFVLNVVEQPFRPQADSLLAQNRATISGLRDRSGTLQTSSNVTSRTSHQWWYYWPTAQSIFKINKSHEVFRTVSESSYEGTRARYIYICTFAIQTRGVRTVFNRWNVHLLSPAGFRAGRTP